MRAQRAKFESGIDFGMGLHVDLLVVYVLHDPPKNEVISPRDSHPPFIFLARFVL